MAEEKRNEDSLPDEEKLRLRNQISSEATMQALGWKAEWN